MTSTGGTTRFTEVVSSVQRISSYYKATTYWHVDTRTINKLYNNEVVASHYNYTTASKYRAGKAESVSLKLKKKKE